MIERIFSAPQLPKQGIEVQKIRALYQAYGTGYDFCKFYKQGSAVLAYLDKNCVLYSDNGVDFDELSDFLLMNGFNDLFCTEETANCLLKHLSADCQTVVAMQFSGKPMQSDIIETDSLSELFGIISTGFDIDFEPWYLDMSHRIRHGVSRAFKLSDTAALVVQHNINGEALLSQIAVVPAARRQGLASKLIKAVCYELFPSKCYVICEPKLCGFYQKVGFTLSGEFCIITPEI